jgi:hypothetical protein
MGRVVRSCTVLRQFRVRVHNEIKAYAFLRLTELTWASDSRKLFTCEEALRLVGEAGGALMVEWEEIDTHKFWGSPAFCFA